MKRSLLHSTAFIRAAKRFTNKNPAAIESFRRTLTLLQEDAWHPSLRTHKLKGALAGCWASSAGYNLRIVFQLVQHGGAEAILLLSVGTHDEVY